MLICALREYLALAKNLSITKTATELHMSQSNLSRHLKNMEKDLGFSLIRRHDNKISLTTCGKKFADGVKEIVDRYDALLQECLELNSMSAKVLQVMDLPYNDEATACYFALIKQAGDRNPMYSFSFTAAYRTNISEALNEGKLDIALSYRYGNPQEHLAEFEGRGLYAHKMTEVAFSIWCKRESPLARQERIFFEDLKSAPILIPNDFCSPVRKALFSLFENHGCKPIFHTVSTASQTEFLMHDSIESVYVLPSSMKDDSRLRTRFDLARVPLADEISRFFCYAIASREGEGKFILEQAAAFSREETSKTL